MRINGSDGSSAIRQLLQRIQQAQTPREPQQTPPQQQPQEEKVKISPQAREIHRLKQIIEEIPDVREKKVEDIRRLIEEGNYKVNLDLLSDKIIESLLVGDL
jgi:flagellar biosynthesis anti-sigma factor FlgM